MADSAGPLDGLLVADFSRVLAGPFAAMTLGDLGADVIKVERPGGGDDTRAWGPPWHGDDATYYLGLNRNKRSVALDLSDDGDRALARALGERADVLIESFRPGLMASWGLGGDALRERNPRLVSCSITAFGSSERAAGLPGYDLLLQAMGGLMSVTGEAEGPPLKVGAAVVDLVCGLLAVAGIEAALVERERTGAGRHVEISLLDSVLTSLLNQGSGWVSAGAEPARRGNRHPSIAPYETYEAADRPFAVAVGNDRLFARLCEAVGLPELGGRRALRHQHGARRQPRRARRGARRRVPHAAGRPLGRGPARRQRPRRADQQRVGGLRAGRVAGAGADPRGRRRPARPPARRHAAPPPAAPGRARRRDPGLAAGGLTLRFPVSVKGVVEVGGRVPLLRNERAEWELPGGRLEAGEALEAAVEREVLEELGLAVECRGLVDAWTYVPAGSGATRRHRRLRLRAARPRQGRAVTDAERGAQRRALVRHRGAGGGRDAGALQAVDPPRRRALGGRAAQLDAVIGRRLSGDPSSDQQASERPFAPGRR